MGDDFANNVVPLGAYRAARFLRGCLLDPSWLETIGIDLDDEGDACVLVRVLSDDPMIRRCLPTKVSGYPVRVVVATANKAGGGR
jgi:hypothetical protein